MKYVDFNEKLIKEFKVNIIENFNNEEEVDKYQLLMKKYEDKKDEKLKEQAYEIRNKIIEQNIPLILGLIRDRCYGYQMPIEDLAIIGSIVLMEAINKYKVNPNTKFSTYASELIMNLMSNEISNWWGEGSEYYGKALRRYTAIVLNEYNSKLALYDQEVMNHVLKRLKDNRYITERAIPELKSRLLSQNTSMKEAENVQDDQSHYDEIIYIRANKDKLFSVLSDYERNIIEYVFGFKDEHPYLMREVAQIYGVSRQTIDRHYNKALEKMKKIVQ